MYKSPIELIETPWRTIVEEKDDKILAVVQSEFGVRVDKEELLKALQYDRFQYTKGYEDGRSDAMDSLVRCKECRLEGMEECPMVYRDPVFGNLYAETKPDDFCSYGERRTK